MIFIALLLLQAAAPGNDVATITNRLERDFKGGVSFDNGRATCKIGKSTGDAAIDRIGCASVETCFPQFQSRFEATRDRAIRPETKKVMQTALNQELANCFVRERATGIAALVAKRRGTAVGR